MIKYYISYPEVVSGQRHIMVEMTASTSIFIFLCGNHRGGRLSLVDEQKGCFSSVPKLMDLYEQNVTCRVCLELAREMMGRLG